MLKPQLVASACQENFLTPAPSRISQLELYRCCMYSKLTNMSCVLFYFGLKEFGRSVIRVIPEYHSLRRLRMPLAKQALVYCLNTARSSVELCFLRESTQRERNLTAEQKGLPSAGRPGEHEVTRLKDESSARSLWKVGRCQCAEHGASFTSLTLCVSVQKTLVQQFPKKGE